MNKLIVSAASCIALAACSTQPLNHDTMRAHAERNCRVQAATTPAYAVDSTGVSLRSVAYDACMRRAGFGKG